MTGNRAATTGLVLAAAQLGFTGALAFLASIVWRQGLPQDYDTVATMSTEAILLGRGALFGALPLLAAFVTSMVLLSTGRAGWQPPRVIAWIMLLFSVILGLIAYRTWGGFGW